LSFHTQFIKNLRGIHTRRCEMKCQLCKRNKALLIVRVGEGTLEVCVNCAIVLKLEPVEVLSVWKTQEQERMEETDKD